MANKQKNLPTNAPSPEQIDQIIANQNLELQVRNREIDLKRQQDAHGFEFGKKALDVQLEDRNLQREHDQKTQKYFYTFISIISVLFVGLLVSAIILDKDQLAMEIVKAAIFLFAGGIGGYGYKAHKVRNTPPPTTP